MSRVPGGRNAALVGHVFHAIADSSSDDECQRDQRRSDDRGEDSLEKDREPDFSLSCGQRL
jgi:hypothetical protein